MEKSLSDLLGDAFSETSVPSFPEDEELGFEYLDFKDDGAILSHSNNNNVEQEDVSALSKTASTSDDRDKREMLDDENNVQEGNLSSEEKFEENVPENSEVLGNFNMHSSTQDDMEQNQNEYSDVLWEENVADNEDITAVVGTLSLDLHKDDQEKLWAKNIEGVKVSERLEDCTSSEEESGEDEDEIKQKAEDFSKTLCCGDDNKPVMAMGQDLDQKGTNRDSNVGESGIEKESYFESIPRNEGELIEGDSSEEELEAESAKTMFFQVEYTLEYPEISYEGVEELSEEVDKMEDFSGDEHQEAGESFADYPSDFSSCEYVNDPRKAQESEFESEVDVEAHCDAAATSEKGVEEVEIESRFMNNDPDIDCTGGNNIGESKDEMHLFDITNQDMCSSFPENEDNTKLQSWTEDVFSTWCNSEDAKSPNSSLPSLQMSESDVDQREPHMNYEDIKGYEQVPTPLPTSHGSVDDSFFFNNEKVPEEEQMDEDEEEEKRREQERIQAFYRFYDDQDGDDDRQERQIKVQFCTETLSQVIQYDTESERESLSSSSDEADKESNQDPEQTFEVETSPSLEPEEVDVSLEQMEEDQHQTQEESLNPTEITKPESINKPVKDRYQKCLSVLKLILSLLFAAVTGLIMFWWWITETDESLPFVL